MPAGPGLKVNSGSPRAELGRALGVLPLGLALLLAQVPSAHAGTPTGSVRGRVIEAGPVSRPLSGVRVLASDPWTGLLDSARTAADGSFQFPRLPAGRVDLAVRARGYVESARRAVPVRSGETVAGVTLRLAPSATLTGRAVDLAGKGIAGAEISAAGARAKSGPDGRFRLGGVRPGEVVLAARSDRYQDANSPRLRLQPGETRALPNLVLLLGRTVSGRVLGEGGRPLGGATLSVGGRTARSGANGQFRLGGLGAGGSLYLWKNGYQGADVPLPPDSFEVSGMTLRLSREKGGPASGLRLSSSRDTWLPTETIPLFLWKRAGEAARVRISDGRGHVVFRAEAKASKPAESRVLVNVPPLAPGVYVVSAATEGGATRMMSLTVSDVALIGETRGGERRVRAVKLADGSAVAGLPVRELQGAVLGRTGEDGVLVVSPGSGVLESADPARPARLQGYDEQSERAAPRVAALADRPAARPGGQVGLKIIVRDEKDAALVPVADSLVTLRLTTGEGPPVERKGRLDGEGVYVDSLPVPSNLEMGRVQVSVTAAGGRANLELPLTNRPTPALKVSISPDRSFALPGDTVRFLVQVRREDGLPASGVTLTLKGSERYSSYDWGEDRSYGGTSSLGLSRFEILASDGSGEASFEQVVPDLLAGNVDFHFEVRAEEAGSEPVEADTKVQALASSRHVSVLDVSPAVVGEPLQAKFALVGLPRRRIGAGAVHVELYRLETQRRVRRATSVESADLTTDSHGEIAWASKCRPAAGEEVRLRVTTADSLGRAAQSEWSWWTSGRRESAGAEVQFELRALRDTLDESAPEARFQVRAGRAGVLHVAIAGREAFQWLPDVNFTAGATEFAVPASQFGAGGLRLLGYATWTGDIFQARADVFVRRTGSRLSVTLEPDFSVASPRDSIGFKVTTRDASGRGVPAEVDVSVYDRGLLSLGGDPNPDLLETFWLPRELQLSLFTSVGRAEAAGGKDSELFARHDFRDVALWLPRLRTGADGAARAYFRAPDNLTTWRLTAAAVGAGTSVGAGKADLTVRRRVALSLSNPQTLVGGDSVVLRVTLREAQGEPERRFSDWGVEVTGGTYSQKSPDVTCSPGRPAEVRIPIHVDPAASTLSVKLRASSNGEGDALEREFRVQPPERTMFGGPAHMRVTWDSLTFRRWNAPALAAALGAGGSTSYPGPEAGGPTQAWRVAALASAMNLDHLGYLSLLEGGAPRGDIAPDREDSPRAANGPGRRSPRHRSLDEERALMLEGVRVARALLRADGSLNMEEACDVLLAGTAGRDTLSPGNVAAMRALSQRVAAAAKRPRVTPEDLHFSRLALAAVRQRLDHEAPSDPKRSALPTEFMTVLDARDLWAAADSWLYYGDCPSQTWLWMIGGRGRGDAGIWPSIVASHLRSREVPVRAALQVKPKPADAAAWLTRAEVQDPQSVTGPPGSLIVDYRRGRASLDIVFPDPMEGELRVKFYRDVPDTNAWGEPSTRELEVSPSFFVGETVKMKVAATRPLEVESTDFVAPLCGAFDVRPAVGAPGSESRPEGEGESRIVHGNVEGGVWRGCDAGSTLWEATVRVTHAGRFTMLPAVIHSNVFPDLFRSSNVTTVEVSP